MNFGEKLDSWIWIRPIPSKPPFSCPKAKKFSKSWTQSFKEWHYNFSSTSITSTGRKLKTKLSSLSESLKMNFIFDQSPLRRKKVGSGVCSQTLDPFYKRMNEDQDYIYEDYLLPKPAKFVTFADSISSLTGSVISDSSCQRMWFDPLGNHSGLVVLYSRDSKN